MAAVRSLDLRLVHDEAHLDPGVLGVRMRVVGSTARSRNAESTTS